MVCIAQPCNNDSATFMDLNCLKNKTKTKKMELLNKYCSWSRRCEHNERLRLSHA